MQIYIGNLPSETTEEELKSMFAPFGKVLSATIGQEKGYGFVEMSKKSEARGAIDALRGKDMQGKPLRVKALKPGDEFFREPRQHGPVGRTGGRFGGDVSYRGSGAIRRGGKRGG